MVVKNNSVSSVADAKGLTDNIPIKSQFIINVGSKVTCNNFRKYFPRSQVIGLPHGFVRKLPTYCRILYV